MLLALREMNPESPTIRDNHVIICIALKSNNVDRFEITIGIYLYWKCIWREEDTGSRIFEFSWIILLHTMPQAWQVHQNIKGASRQSPEAVANLELHDFPKPVPGPREALIRIHAGP